MKRGCFTLTARTKRVYCCPNNSCVDIFSRFAVALSGRMSFSGRNAWLVLRTNSFSVTGSRLIPKRVCKLAPARSASTRMTSCPSRARAQAVFTATRVLPTPPFPPPTAQMVPLMSLMESMVIPERIADKKRWSAQRNCGAILAIRISSDGWNHAVADAPGEYPGSPPPRLPPLPETSRH